MQAAPNRRNPMTSLRASLATTTLVAVALAATPARAAAQDFGDIAAYAALILTPAGGLVPLPPPGGPATKSAFLLRYGLIDGEFGSSLNHFAVSGDFGTGRGRLGLTLGYSACSDDCDNGSVMAGLDYTVSLTQNVISVGLRPALGFSKPTEGDGNALSAALSLPLGVDFSGTTGPVFTPYLVPGLGFGRVSGGDESESGMRPMLGGGFAISGRQTALSVHLGFQKVFIDEGEMTFGLGLSFGRR
jgi:hypothetical protein